MGMVHSIEEDQQEAASVTSGDLLETARTVFTPDNLRLVAVGPWTAGIKKQTRALVQKYTRMQCT